MNLNLNGLPEGGGEESAIKLPIDAGNGDPMAIWESKLLQPEQQPSPGISVNEVDISVVTPEMAAQNAAEAEWKDIKPEELDEAAGALLEFVKAMMEMLQSKTGMRDLMNNLNIGKWEEIPLDESSSLFIRYNGSTEIGEDAELALDEEYDMFEGLTEEELDAPCPTCGRPVRDHRP